MATTKRTLAAVEAEIAQTKEALANVKGSETEVYARIVGYYRSVRNWNKGKRDEYNHRKQFVYTDSYAVTEADSGCSCANEVPVISAIPAALASDAPASYEFYARKTCPNCPPVKDYMAHCAVAGTVIDVDTSDGLAKAAEKGVFSAPTVILYGSDGTEIARAHNTAELAAVFEPVAAAV